MSSPATAPSADAAVVICTSLSAALVESWLDHCAACFADKEPYPTPRSYFETHLRKDPMMDLNGVAIVMADEAAIPPTPVEATAELATKEDKPAAAPVAGQYALAATTRVVVRQQYINGTQTTIGGIGEVCTKKEYRKRGFAELALTRSLAYSRKLQLQLTSLHASAAMAPYYSGKGFQSVERWFGIKSDFEREKDVNIVGEGLQHGAFSLRLMPVSQFTNPSMMPQFTAMYDTYSKQFNGPLVRSQEYWDTWVQADLETSIGARHRFPVEIYTAFEEWDGSDPAPVPASPVRFLAYMFLQRVHCAADDGGENRDRLYVIREYSAIPLWAQRADGGRQIFLSLVQYAVRQIRHKFAEVDPQAAARAKISVKFPLPLTAKFAVPLTVDEEVLDGGFMYQPLPLDLVTPAAADAAPASTFRDFRSHRLEDTPIHSPFAASPYVLHHASEAMTATSANEMLDMLKQEAKSRVIFWGTDAF